MSEYLKILFFFFFQAEDGIRDLTVTGVQTCALPIFTGARSCPWRWPRRRRRPCAPPPARRARRRAAGAPRRSEEHTSELQSQSNIVCRLLLEKKKNTQQISRPSHSTAPVSLISCGLD